jgi:hypothetical protein
MIYRADLKLLHDRCVCSSCGEIIEAAHWAYVDGERVWHRSCTPPLVLSDDEPTHPDT